MSRVRHYALGYANERRQALGASTLNEQDLQGIVDELTKHAMAGDEKAAGLLHAIGLPKLPGQEWPAASLTE